MNYPIQYKVAKNQNDSLSEAVTRVGVKCEMNLGNPSQYHFIICLD